MSEQSWHKAWEVSVRALVGQRIAKVEFFMRDGSHELIVTTEDGLRLIVHAQESELVIEGLTVDE